MKLILPDALMFGFGGSAPFPWLIILAYSHRNNTALIAHEQHHQLQQRRDGWLRFWLNYLSSKELRFSYELEAYKVWLNVRPEDFFKVSHWLTHNYGLDMSQHEVEILLNT